MSKQPQFLLPFGEFRPDVADYDGSTSKTINGVVPQGDGYGPFPSLAGFTSNLPATTRGVFNALKTDGSVSIFAGTGNNLYNLNNTNQTWTTVSSTSISYTGPSNTRNWSFAQFNNFVLATNANDPVQVFDLTASNFFSNLAGSPPNADFVAVVNRFVVLTGIASPNVYRVQWSGLNAITTWDNITNLSNFQDMADGGLVRGIVGGNEWGIVFQDRAVRQMIFEPGSALIFGIYKISSDDGLFAPYSVVMSGENIFYISNTGFKMIPSGSSAPVPIGKERVDRTFFNMVDASNLQLCIGSADPDATRIYWAFKSNNGTTGQFDTVFIYDRVLDRWSQVQFQGTYLASLAKPGLTLEGVDAAYGKGTPVAATSFSTTGLITQANTYTAGQGGIFTTSGTLPAWYSANTPYYVMSTNLTTTQFQVSASGGVGALQGAVRSSTSTTSTSTGTGTLSFAIEAIENLSIPSLDSVPIASELAFGGVTTSGSVGFFNGPNLAANLETAERNIVKGRTMFIRGLRPVTDASNLSGYVQDRFREENPVAASSATTLNAIGQVPVRISCRYARAHITITAGSTWTFAAGVEPEVMAEGER